MLLACTHALIADASVLPAQDQNHLKAGLLYILVKIQVHDAALVSMREREGAMRSWTNLARALLISW